MATFPLEVEVNEKNITKLVKVFEYAQTQIAKEIEGATDFGVRNRKSILRQIDSILDDLSKQISEEVVGKEIPNQYMAGADDAVGQLEDVGAKINVKTGFNLVHKDAIQALVDDTARAFGESMTGVKRNATRLLDIGTKERITLKLAKGNIGGEDLRRIKNQVVGVMREQGIASLIDKGGKKWELDRYAEMLIRTKSVEARNKGLINRMEENDYDLVQVSAHGSTHEECAVWEGKILSATGRTKGYPTLAEAEASGLFHPNCKHAVNVIIPELARQTKAYDFRTGKTT